MPIGISTSTENHGAQALHPARNVPQGFCLSRRITKKTITIADPIFDSLCPSARDVKDPPRELAKTRYAWGAGRVRRYLDAEARERGSNPIGVFEST